MFDYVYSVAFNYYSRLARMCLMMSSFAYVLLFNIRIYELQRFENRRTGFKCVVKCLHLRENKLIALPIIAIADDLSHIHANPVHVVPGSNNFLRSNDCESAIRNY